MIQIFIEEVEVFIIGLVKNQTKALTLKTIILSLKSNIDILCDAMGWTTTTTVVNK